MRTDGFGPLGKPRPPGGPRARPATALVETPFSPNPGNLRMFCHLPRGLKAGAPLVVILHGCGQSAAGYAAGTGWPELADRLGFAVLAPEQKASNNPATCFDWFNPGDVGRGQGEAESIAVMVREMLRRHKLDAARVFITGLSAGGGMAAAMLAAYPEMFAGGALIAGLPVGAATGIGEAIGAMRGAPLRSPRAWGNAVRAAAPHDGPWPKVSIWHGEQDSTVDVSNAQASVAQWADVHGLALRDGKQDSINGAVRLRWGDQLEVITVPGLGHGVPINSRQLGAPAPYVLEAGISSTIEIASFWKLDAKADVKAEVKPAAKAAAKPSPALPRIEQAVAPQTSPASKLEQVIRRALKVAGLRD